MLPMNTNLDRRAEQDLSRPFVRIPCGMGTVTLPLGAPPYCGPTGPQRSGIGRAIRDARPPHPGGTGVRLLASRPTGSVFPSSGRSNSHRAEGRPATDRRNRPQTVPYAAQCAVPTGNPNRSGCDSGRIRPVRGTRSCPASVGTVRGSAPGFPMVGNNGRLCPQPMGRQPERVPCPTTSTRSRCPSSAIA